MYNTKDLQEAIIKLKKEKDVCILAHAYQTQDILEVADSMGIFDKHLELTPTSLT